MPRRPPGASSGRSDDAPRQPKLEGWKAIADYFGRTVRTVQRWERDHGLPVRRQLHSALSSAYAVPVELDAWRATRTPRDEGFDPSNEGAEAGDEHILTALSRHYWKERSKDAFAKSIALAEAALSRNPRHAPAHAALARTYATRASYGYFPPLQEVSAAKTYARKALEADPTLIDAHLALGFVHLFFEWDWPASKLDFDTALRLGPDEAPTHQWFTMWFMAQGQDSRALEMARRAEMLDPASPVIHAHATWILHMLGHFDEAISRSRTAIRRDRSFWRGYFSLAIALSATGRCAEAANVAQVADALNEQTALAGIRAHALAKSGQTEAAHAILQRRLSEATFFSPYWLAFAYVGLEAYDEAFSALERSVQEREWFLLFLNHEPAFIGLRDDPRFDDIRLRIGLPQRHPALTSRTEGR